ncbi:MAG: hypothetical protein HXY46_08260 [Syntrophaceae bacterium]|nr:hypothetical protein [Syntrophaceae bacterium]
MAARKIYKLLSAGAGESARVSSNTLESLQRSDLKQRNQVSWG